MKKILSVILAVVFMFSTVTMVNAEGTSSSSDDIETNNLVAGDINGDSKVAAGDVTTLRRYIAGGDSSNINLDLADVDLDGTIKAKDVTVLRRFLADGWDIELELPEHLRPEEPEITENPEVTENPEEPEITESPEIPDVSDAVIIDGVLDISKVPTCGTFVAAGYGENEYVINYQNGGTNDDKSHSIGKVDLSKYVKIEITYGNDGSAEVLGKILLKNATDTLAEVTLEPAAGWKTTAVANLNVSNIDNYEEIFIEYVPDAGNGIVVTKVEFLENEPEEPIVPEEPEVTDAVIVEGMLDISKVPTCGTFEAAGYPTDQFVLNMGTGGTNDKVSHSIGKVNLSQYRQIIITYCTADVETIGGLFIKNAEKVDLAENTILPSGGWKTPATTVFNVSDMTAYGELFIELLPTAGNGIVITSVEFVENEIVDDPDDDALDAVIVDGKLDISKTPTCGTFTDAGYADDKYVLNFQSGGTNSDVVHSLGKVDLSKYEKMIITYGNDQNATELGALFLKNKVGDLTSISIEPATSWLETSTAKFDISGLGNYEELFIEYLASGTNGIVVTEIEFIENGASTDEPEEDTGIQSASDLRIDGVENVLTQDITGSLNIQGGNLIVDLAGHKWTNDDNVLVLNTGSVTIYDSVGGGIVESFNKDAISMGNGTLIVKDITIKANADSMDAVYVDGGSFTAYNCTFVAPKAGINVSNGSESSDPSAYATVEISGGKFASFDGTVDSKGRNCAIEIKNNADTILLSDDIIFENNRIISLKTNEKSIDEAITIGYGKTATYIEEEALADYNVVTIDYKDASSEGGNTEGDTDNNPFDFVYGGETNVLTSDIEGTLRLTGETIEIDLAGHNWICDDHALIVATGNITIKDSVGGGAIISTAKDAIVMGNGEVRLENITIQGNGDNMDAVLVNGGNITLYKCTLSAPKAGLHIANEAETIVAIDECVFANYDGEKDSKGRNCAIEIKNDAEDIRFYGNCVFENNIILSANTNTIAIEDSFTVAPSVSISFTEQESIEGYNVATIAYSYNA